jgi:hypothetical protein
VEKGAATGHDPLGNRMDQTEIVNLTLAARAMGGRNTLVLLKKPWVHGGQAEPGTLTLPVAWCQSTRGRISIILCAVDEVSTIDLSRRWTR